MNFLIIEEASLELVPQKYQNSSEAMKVAQRFGVTPSMQILDRNFHPRAVASLKEDREKRGRPDVVHFALLDACSTPLFEARKLRVFVRARGGLSFEVKAGTRLPRTLQRFCGVAAKLLSGRHGTQETELFSIYEGQGFEDLLHHLKIDEVISLTSQGVLGQLREIVQKELSHETKKEIAWVIGGFPHGHFKPDIVENSDLLLSISDGSLPAHVVAARLCYELEVRLNRTE